MNAMQPARGGTATLHSANTANTADRGLPSSVFGSWRTVLAVAITALATVMAPTPASAQYATGGSGQYRNQILWFDWQAPTDTDPDITQSGETITNSIDVAGQTLTVTCSLSNITSAGADPDLRVYRPGGFSQDGLDDLYNIGGIGALNTMDIGVRNRVGGVNVAFTYSCSATLGGLPYTLDGLVFADAESTSGTEFIQATLPATATMRVIERTRGSTCADPYNVTRTGTTYRMTSTGDCRDAGENPPGPTGIFFIDNASTANMVMEGSIEAVALGVMLEVADFGDAPSSYGIAAHVPQYAWSGGTLPNNTTTNIFNIGLAAQAQPVVALLGARADVETASLFSANALGDDSNSSTGTDDEDGVNIGAAAPLYRGLSGNSYSMTATCVGTASVAGWIDFDRNGTFDSDERSATALCAGGSATMTWTVPTDIAAGATFLRVRTAVNALEIANATGVAGTGEVEDHTLTIVDPRIRVAKLTQAGAGGPFAFTTTNTLSQPGALTTVAANTAVTGTPVSIDDIAAALTVTESALPADWQLTAIACAQAGGAPVAGATYDLANRRATLPSTSLSATSDITCTFTNGKRPILRLAKALPLGRFVAADQFALSIAGQGGPATATTTGSGSTATEVAVLNPGTIGGVYTLSETAAAGALLSNYATTYACTNALAGGQTPSGSGASFNLTAALGDDLTCTLTNTRNPLADLRISKTNSLTPATEPNDLPNDTVSRGATTTYTIVVTNAGPDAVIGAILRDQAANRVGLSCTAPPVCTGAGCPASPLTLAGLEAGAPLGTIANGASVTVTLSCVVN
ncbi:DUF11 domain-containing protein [Lysobacter sp. BMK333-48F3]|uniref:CshA/CshB family fibrillar adhesin-related protein n=1 Tax=Lysobacter sp. BMK333-48F3 TaxID=2867962 RepID=UPI001C8C3072|nr:CshA/CshB family fibrillar adhesin-related protein [Lysobacter sp. BMK333-48F3]MBX9400915.1 DUF11 domain-containing protein [Lysobacter sp. BMK333-48F3]